MTFQTIKKSGQSVLDGFFMLQAKLSQSKNRKKIVQQIKICRDKKSWRFIKRIRSKERIRKKQHHFFLLTGLKQSFSEIRFRFPSRLQIEKPFPIVIDDWKHLLLRLLLQRWNRISTALSVLDRLQQISQTVPFFSFFPVKKSIFECS